MAAMTEMSTEQTAALSGPPADSVDCRATVVTAGLATGMLNGNPLVPQVDLLVEAPGLPPAVDHPDGADHPAPTRHRRVQPAAARWRLNLPRRGGRLECAGLRSVLAPVGVPGRPGGA